MSTGSASPVSEKALEHAAYLVQGDDRAMPDDCSLCAELRDAGRLELVKRKYRQERWEVRRDGVA